MVYCPGPVPYSLFFLDRTANGRARKRPIPFQGALIYRIWNYLFVTAVLLLLACLVLLMFLLLINMLELAQDYLFQIYQQPRLKTR